MQIPNKGIVGWGTFVYCTLPMWVHIDPFGMPSGVKGGGVVRVKLLVLCLHDTVLCSVVSHCAHPTVPVDIWARYNSVSWDNSTLGLVVWIGINSWLLWINLYVDYQHCCKAARVGLECGNELVSFPCPKCRSVCCDPIEHVIKLQAQHGCVLFGHKWSKYPLV